VTAAFFGSVGPFEVYGLAVADSRRSEEEGREGVMPICRTAPGAGGPKKTGRGNALLRWTIRV
jgi:hypothetical protein